MITKLIHWYYWMLRTLHLRPKAKAWFVTEKGMHLVKFDKLDPGEKVEIEGEFLLHNGKIERVDGTKKSKRNKK